MLLKMSVVYRCFFFFFFNDTATTEIYTLSLHDALPIPRREALGRGAGCGRHRRATPRSEEHTSELQSRQYLVCRLLLEKKKRTQQQARASEEMRDQSEDDAADRHS